MYGRRNPLTDIWTYIKMGKAEYRALPDAEREAIRAKAYQDMQAAKEKRKAEIVEEKAAKDKTARTCQICARRIFAETGKIAHHGYERPGGGWQTASCRGARRLPYETDHVALDEEITWVAERLEREEVHLAKLQAEEVALGIKWVDQAERRANRSNPLAGFRYLGGITRETWDAMKADPVNAEAFRQCYSYTFDDLKKRHVEDQKDTVRHVSTYLKSQRRRRAEWVKKATWADGKWVCV